MVKYVFNPFTGNLDSTLSSTDELPQGLTNLYGLIPENSVEVKTGCTEVAGKRYSSIANALTYIATQTPTAVNLWGICLLDYSNSEDFTLGDYTTIYSVKGLAGLFNTILTGDITLGGYSTLNSVNTTGQITMTGTIGSGLPSLFYAVYHTGTLIIGAGMFFEPVFSILSCSANVDLYGYLITVNSSWATNSLNVNAGGYLGGAFEMVGGLIVDSGGTFAVNEAGQHYDNSLSGLTADTVGDAIDEVLASIPLEDYGTQGSITFLDANGRIDEDNANFFWDSVNKRMGIGTDSPTGKLHFKAGSTSYGSGGIRFEQSADTSFWDIMPSYNSLFFGRDGTTYYKMTTSGLQLSDGGSNIYTHIARSGDSYFNAGNVGIGTATPNAKLQVVGDTHLGADTTNYTEIKDDGEINLHGTARVTKTKTFTFNYARITGQGKPTLVNRGVFFGWSLPIFNSDDEELYSCSCAPTDWDGVTDPVFSISGWLDTANTDKKFNMQISVETYDPNTNEVVPITTNDISVETDTGTAAQYTSFIVPFTLDASAIDFNASEPIGIRIRRLDASENEIAGEFVVEGAVVSYVSNKLGEAT